MYNRFQNANMSQKSLIQVVLERNAMIEKLKHSINTILESYNIEGNVFGIRQGQPYEFQTGYFVVENESDSLQEAIQNMTSLNSCIRIDGNKFQTGNVYNYITECDANKPTIDIDTQTIVVR